MLLHRLHLDPRCWEARRDLADPYQLHSTLCRAFSPVDKKCSSGEFLWRLEPESDEDGASRILVQSRSIPTWSRIGIANWLTTNPDPPINLQTRLRLDSLAVGQRFRFRLRGNPSVTRNGKRFGLFSLPEQEAWLVRKGEEQHGFMVDKFESFDLSSSSVSRLDVQVSEEQMIIGRKHGEGASNIRLFAVLYDGNLTVMDPMKFRRTLETGIGHGKVLGLGLLSVVPKV